MNHISNDSIICSNQNQFKHISNGLRFGGALICFGYGRPMPSELSVMIMQIVCALIRSNDQAHVQIWEQRAKRLPEVSFRRWNETDQAFNECARWMNDPFEMVQFDMFMFLVWNCICKSIVNRQGNYNYRYGQRDLSICNTPKHGHLP